MKVKIGDIEYSGYIVKNEEEVLTVVIHTIDDFDTVAQNAANVKQVEEIDSDENKTAYAVTAPLSAKVVSNYVYSIDFSTKLTVQQETDEKIQAQSDAIDELLIMVLEG